MWSIWIVRYLTAIHAMLLTIPLLVYVEHGRTVAEMCLQRLQAILSTSNYVIMVVNQITAILVGPIVEYLMAPREHLTR